MSKGLRNKTHQERLDKTRMSPPRGPLAGFRVADFSQVLAAPYLGTMLSDMGAEVIKIEASYGDAGRSWPPFKQGKAESCYYANVNRGKYGLCMDLSKPRSIEICKELIKVSDILIENWRPGVMSRRGLGYEHAREINPAIVYLSISGFGTYGRYAPAAGPNSTRVAYDIIAQAESGYHWMNGFPDKPPHGLDVCWSDIQTGTHAAVSIAAAMIHRLKTGRGQWIDIGLTDSMVASNENLIAAVSMNGEDAPPPRRNGLRRLSITPYGVFKAKDDYFVIGVDSDRRFELLCTAMEKPQLAEDPKFATNAGRLENREEIEGIVEEWCAQHTVDECVEILRNTHGVPAGPILSNLEYIRHPHFREREMLQPIEQAGAGNIEVHGVPCKLSASPGKIQGAAPLLGEHNRTILKKRLGYSDEEIDGLYDDLVLVDNIDYKYPIGKDIVKLKEAEATKGGK